MAFPIIPKKRSGATGSPTSLTVGELAVNTATGELFLGGDSAVLLLNPPTAAGTTTTERTGDGTTVAFTFTGYNGTADGGYLVSVGGIDQPPSKYAVSSTAGGTLTFVEAPTAGELISIRALVASSGGGGGSGTVTSITAGDGLDGGTITESGTISLAAVTTAQSNVGSGTQIPVLSINDKGQVTALATIEFAGLTTAQIAGLSTTAPAALATSAVVGLSTFAARADHQHVFPSAADVGALGATASASGDLTGNYPGPTLAAITTAQSNVGSSTVVPVLSIDAKGRVTSLSTAAISSTTTSAITSLTGDVIAAGPGAASAALAAITTAQSNVGSSTQIPVLSIDEKGRVTALSSVAAANSQLIDFLVIAGGGGASAAGGGAGGFRSGSLNIIGGNTYAVTIGAGGAGAASTATAVSGSNSSLVASATITAIGGGRSGVSGSTNGTVGASGGSGGGAGANGSITNTLIAGGSGTIGQGNDGGGTPGLIASPTGGGGGAGGAGANGAAGVGGNGGIGRQSSITGTATYYAGGGGGSVGSGTQGTGGLGGGGNGATSTVAQSGTANTGGGGGGGSQTSGTGGAGGSGVVILSIPTAVYTGLITGSPVVTTSGSRTILKFNSSGTYTD